MHNGTSCREYKSIRESTNAELLAECALESRPALEEFFIRFNVHITSAIKKALFNHASEHLACSDAFHAVSSRVIDKLLYQNKLAECEKPDSICHWLETLCRNEVISWLREKGLLKNLPKQPIEDPGASIHQPLSGTSDEVLGDILQGRVVMPGDEPEKQLSPDDVLAALIKIPDARNRWVCRLWIMGIATLSAQEMRDLADYAGIALADLQSRVAHMMRKLAGKKTAQEHAEIISLRLWHRLRRHENEQYNQYCRPSAAREQELRREITKLSNRYEKKRKIVEAHIRPSNIDIAACIGMPTDKAAQISNIFARNADVFSALMQKNAHEVQ